MLNKLTHASTLRVEIEGFKKTARSQPNKNIQEKVLKLCKEILRVAESIDQQHDSRAGGFIRPNLASDDRDKIVRLRSEVQSLLSIKT